MWISSNQPYSNTSHVLIYRYGLHYIHQIFLFKYISCSYLSSDNQNETLRKMIFKYISCSYLSNITHFNTILIIFKYISCSYLSKNSLPLPLFSANSNTSHVLIYLYSPVYLNHLQYYSNTSHVLIYQYNFRNNKG